MVSIAIRVSSPPSRRHAVDHDRLGLLGDGMHDEPTAGTERLPAEINDLYRGPTADEDRIRQPAVRQRRRRLSHHDLQLRNAQPGRVQPGPLGACPVPLDRDGPAAGVDPAPLDSDRAGAGADIPEQLTWGGHQVRQRGGPYVPLRELSVMIEDLVRKARRQRRGRGWPIGNAGHAGDIEARQPDRTGLVPTCFRRRSKISEHGDLGTAKACFSQRLPHTTGVESSRDKIINRRAGGKMAPYGSRPRRR